MRTRSFRNARLPLLLILVGGLAWPLVGEGVKANAEPWSLYRQALELVEGPAAPGPRASALFLQAAAMFSEARQSFNAGNAYFMAGDLGHAMIEYLKAEASNPWDPRLAYNQEVLRKEVSGSDPNRSAGSPFWSSLWFFQVLLAAAVVSLQVAAILAGVRFFRSGRFFSRTVLLLAAIGSLFALTAAWQRWSAPLRAVIIQATPGYKGDSQAFETVREPVFRPGQDLEVIEERSGYVLGRWAPGEEAWFPAGEIEKVFP